MNEMVTITCAEYDRLRPAAEDLGDLRPYDRTRAALALSASWPMPSGWQRTI